MSTLNRPHTFRELADWYDEAVAPYRLRPHTRQRHRAAIKTYFLPILGEEDLENINRDRLCLLFQELRRFGRRNHRFRLRSEAGKLAPSALSIRSGVSVSLIYRMLQGKTISESSARKVAQSVGKNLHDMFQDVTGNPGLSASAVNQLKRQLSALFNAAVENGFIARNPCTGLSLPSDDTPPAACLNREEAQRLLDTIRAHADPEFARMIRLLLTTGIRAGELCALCWEDFDETRGTLSIHHTLIRLNGESLRVPPKTPSSCRTVYLPFAVSDDLRQHRKERQKSFEKCRRIISPVSTYEEFQKQPVFTNRQGGFLLPTNVNQKLRRLLKGSTLPPVIHLHTLRHTYASLLINGDIPSRVIADQMGHRSTRTTLDLYGHVYRESRIRAMQTVTESLLPK